MHIALFSPGWPADEFPSGIVTYVHLLRAALLKQGHRVSVLTNAVGSTNRDADIHLVNSTVTYKVLASLARVRGRANYSVFSWGKAVAEAVMRLHAASRIDVLEMEESFGWCAHVRDLTGIPVVVKLHGPAFLSRVAGDLGGESAAQRIRLEGDALRRISAITAPSRTTLQDTTNHYGLSPPISRVIPNPVALERDIPLWDVTNCDRKTVLFVGRFDRLKGGDTVLAIFRKLLDADPSLRLIFVGPDVGWPSPTGSLIRFAQFCNGLFSPAERRHIEYLGQLPRRVVFQLRLKAMVILVASRWENQPNTALEAMVQSCPVVAFETGGMNEVIETGVTGLLAKPDHVEEYCRHVMSLLNEPTQAGEMGRRARSVVIDRHSPAEVAKVTVDVYDQALALASRWRN